VSRVKFRILGPLEVERDGRLVALGGGQQRALLAVLLLHANEPVSADRLVEELWGEPTPPRAVKRLQVAVTRLRQALDADDLGATAKPALRTTTGGYLLAVGPGELDADAFQTRVQDGRQALAAGESARAAKLLGEALALWRGPALAEVAYEPFAQAEIRRLEELRLATLEARIEADLRLSRHAALTGELEMLVADHPTREPLAGQLMLALYRSGRQANALDTYQRTRTHLAAELGLEPGPALKALQAQILEQSPALELAADDAKPPMTHRALDASGDTARPAAAGALASLRVGGRRRGGLVGLLAAALIAATVGAAALTNGDRERAATSGTLDLAPNSIAAVDGTSGALRLTLPLVGHPTDLVAAEGMLWAVTVDSTSLTAVDLRTRKITRAVPLPLTPAAVAVGEGAVWVADGQRRQLVAVRKGYEDLSAPIRLGRGRRAPGVAEDATSVAVGGGSVWVTDGSATLARIDAGTRRVTAIPAGRPLVAVTVGAGAVWAISAERPSVLRIDPRTNTITDRVTLAQAGASAPFPAGVAATGDAVWVLSRNTATVTRIDRGTRNIAAIIPIRAERVPNEIAAAARTVWVANDDGTLSRIDAASNAVRSVRVGESLRELAVDGAQVWVGTTALDQQLAGGTG
jgi:DNA-binding SARP family transcriptional activator/DNA-binding beta-propeller fold protein YncE